MSKVQSLQPLRGIRSEDLFIFELSHRREFASFAVDRYQSFGRGAIRIPFDHVLAYQKDELFPINELSYVSLWKDGRVTRHVEGYNPKTQLVLAYIDAAPGVGDGYDWIYRKGAISTAVQPLRRLEEETEFPEAEAGDRDFLYPGPDQPEATFRPGRPPRTQVQRPSRGGINLTHRAEQLGERRILGGWLANLIRFLKGI